jgi:hypothetical protein
MTATPFLSSPIPQVTVADTDCAIQFGIPSSWRWMPLETELYARYRCAFGLIPPGWEEFVSAADVFLPEYAILVVVFDLPMEESALQALFEFREGNWIATGRHGVKFPAYLVLDGARLILKGSAPFGMTSKETHAYAGMALAKRAVISLTQDRSALVETADYQFECAVSIDEAVELVIRSILATNTQ